MNIGRLDRKVTIEEPSLTASSTTGERTQTWVTLAVVWATVTYPKTMAMNEGLEQSRLTAVTPVEFTIRWRTDVTVDMRVYYRGEYFEIKRINEVGQRNEMLKLVTERRD